MLDAWPRAQGKVHFTEAMTSKLVGNVKLVGPTIMISCDGTGQKDSGQRRSTPYVQPYAVATDAAGMRVLVEDGKAFQCQTDGSHHSHAASTAILKAGYNIDCFMVRAVHRTA